MEKDFRASSEFASVTEFYAKLLGPAGHVFGARGLCGHESDPFLYLIGQSLDGGLTGSIFSRLYRIRREGGKLECLNDIETRQIRLSPNGRRLVVACAGDAPGTDRIEIWMDGRQATTRNVAGRIEQIDWSPDGARVLLVVAGQGADLAGIHGGYAQKMVSDAPPWLPEVQTNEGEDLWRAVWLWDGESAPQQLTRPPLNVWEASWCGNEAIAAVTSSHHGEGSWYRAELSLIGAKSGLTRILHKPRDQLGWVKGCPAGKKIAFVDAFCSDRGLVAGRLSVLDLTSGKVATLETNDIDVTCIEWRSPGEIHLAGARGPETVTGDYDLDQARMTESWASAALTNGEWVPASQAIGRKGALFVAEAYAKAPFLAEEEGGRLREIASLAAPQAQSAMATAGDIAPVSWTAPDGWKIDGWLVRPHGAAGATPLLVDVHGGPISAHRNRWMARARAAALLANRGWTVFFPNPRGSTGRGDVFARAVDGDMGGADALDILSGIDALVEKGLVDTKRVAVTGTSYGGFMSAWLPSRTERFAAAIPISPVGDWYSQHRVSQIPEFDEIMLKSSPWAAGGAYFDRSPAFHKQKAPVPTLILAGAIDKNTPVGQAQECHFAAQRSGAPSALVIYPHAGHSVRGYPEYFDTAARILWWLGKYV